MRLVILCFALLVGSHSFAHAVGFERLVVPGSHDINVGVWYPSQDAIPEEPNTPFLQSLALAGTPEGSGLPLIVISHGDGGWMGGHAGTALALAERGYVVAAPEHAGNNSEDESATPSEWIVTRPQEISTVIDFMLNDWRHSEILAPERVGVFGFSAGGYTALASAGAKPDFSASKQHCLDEPDELVCKIGYMRDIAEGPDVNSLKVDNRIRAISIAAPAFGFLFSQTGLSDVDAKVQIWSGEVDDRVPHASNGALIAKHLPGEPDVHIVKNAGHFAFLAPCDPRLPRLKAASPEVWAMVCVDAEGFDRQSFQRRCNSQLATFFDAALAI